MFVLLFIFHLTHLTFFHHSQHSASLRLESELESGRVSGSVSVEWTTVKLIIDEIISSAAALQSSSGDSISADLTSSLLDIFDTIISNPTFR